MLDYIYRKAMEYPDVKYFVLFTGDGHFQSVVKFLRNKCEKKVIQYGVKGCCSKQLCDAALEHYSVPTEDIKPSVYYPMIIERLDWAAKHPEVIVTFMNTVRYVSQRNEISEAIIIQALNQMLDSDLICKNVGALISIILYWYYLQTGTNCKNVVCGPPKAKNIQEC